MTLKDKFDETLTYLESKNKISELEQIADEYAKQVLVSYINSEILQYKQSQGVYSLDELLQIIKKEKGL